MKKQILFLSLLMLTRLVFSLQILQQSDCQLCMQTYKRNCTICYKKCNEGKDFSSCAYSECSAYDQNNNCVNWSSQSLNQNNCLNKCCDGFTSGSVFNEPSFNLCIERDAYNTDNINIGLTIGLILSLLALLFSAGLACLLVMICIDNNGNKSSNIPSAEGINTLRFNTKPNFQTWLTEGIPLNGMCFICNAGLSNTMASCGHHFHFSCLANSVKVTNDQRCPACRTDNSLKTAKIYCSGCRKQYKIFDSEKQLLDPRASYAMESLKCPKCQ